MAGTTISRAPAPASIIGPITTRPPRNNNLKKRRPEKTTKIQPSKRFRVQREGSALKEWDQHKAKSMGCKRKGEAWRLPLF
jgi:hypothetical protein